MKNKLLLNKFLITALIFFIGSAGFAQLNPAVIGTIQPGDSIVIFYDVTINTGLPPTVTRISNQGAVSGTGINMVTDDPDTPAPNDITHSVLNGAPLPVTLTELRAFAKPTGIDVIWNTSLEMNMIRYEVERSIDGRMFTKIGEVRSLNSALPATYSFFDINPNNGVNFYRLRLIDQTTPSKYSSIVRVDRDGKNGGIRIYPNPVVDHNITLQLNNMQKGNYELLLYSGTGQLVYRTTIKHDGGSANKNFMLPGSLTKGAYSIWIKDEQMVFNQRLLIK